MFDPAQAAVDKLVADDATPAIQWAVGRLDGSVELFVAGVADVASSKPITRQTIFLSASMTKLITAILVLQFVDSGEISLGTPLAAILSHIPYSWDVTVGRVLAHRGGLPNPNPMTWVHTRQEASNFDEWAALDRVMTKHPRAHGVAGARYRYSNVGYWLLGRMLEQLGGQTYDALVQHRVAAPLHLDENALRCAFPQPERAARGHVRRFGLIYPIMRCLLPWQLATDHGGAWVRLVDLTMNGAAYGGIFATSEGYLAVLIDMLSDTPVLLAPASRDLLFRPQFSTGEGDKRSMAGLGLGELDGHRFAFKSGGGPGFSGNLRLYPEIGLASVWMQNRLSFSERKLNATSDCLDRLLITRPLP